MSVPNVHFVLGVHLSQLRNTVKAAYGSEIDATAYLQKFINLTITHADAARHSNEQRVTKHIEYLRSKLITKPDDAQGVEIASEFLQRIAEHRSMSLRTVERVFSHIVVCFAFTTTNQLRLPPLIAGLCILKVIEPDLYALAKTRRLKYQDIEKLFGFDVVLAENDTSNMAWQRQWWQYCLLESIPAEVQELGGSLRKYNIFGGRENLLQLIANAIVDSLMISK